MLNFNRSNLMISTCLYSGCLSSSLSISCKIESRDGACNLKMTRLHILIAWCVIKAIPNVNDKHNKKSMNKSKEAIISTIGCGMFVMSLSEVGSQLI